MFTEPTALILGAGASYDFGVPLGEELLLRVFDSWAALQNSYTEGVLDGVDERIDPKGYAYLTEGSRHSDRLERGIAARMRAENIHTSLDEFIRDYPSLRSYWRILVAAVLFESLYETRPDGVTWALRDVYYQRALPNLRHAGPTVENWIGLFVSLCRSTLTEHSPPFPVDVISFNYDRVFETIARELWPRGERRVAGFESCFRFAYPYGSLQTALPRTIVEPGKWLLSQAPGIVFMDEAVETDTLKTTIQSANRILALGFSFSASNIQRLGLTELDGSRMFVQNFGNRDRGLARRLKTLGVHDEHVDLASLPDLVRGGFLLPGA